MAVAAARALVGLRLSVYLARDRNCVQLYLLQFLLVVVLVSDKIHARVIVVADDIPAKARFVPSTSVKTCETTVLGRFLGAAVCTAPLPVTPVGVAPKSTSPVGAAPYLCPP